MGFMQKSIVYLNLKESLNKYTEGSTQTTIYDKLEVMNKMSKSPHIFRKKFKLLNKSWVK